MNFPTPYCSIDDADNYFTNASQRTNVDLWIQATDIQKTKVLTAATIAIDRLFFQGVKTDPNQLTEFPRDGSTIVPDNIKMACAEIGFDYLDDVDITYEEQNIGVVVDAYAGVRRTYSEARVPEHIKAGIPNIIAWRLIKPYLVDPLSMQLTRTT